jgi:hypothetical protein
MSDGYPIIDVGTDNARPVLFTSRGGQVRAGQREYSYSEIHDVSRPQEFDSAVNLSQARRAAGIPASVSSVRTFSSVRPRRHVSRPDREEELHA